MAGLSLGSGGHVPGAHVTTVMEVTYMQILEGLAMTSNGEVRRCNYEYTRELFVISHLS